MTKVTKHTSPVQIKQRKELSISTGDTVKVWQKIEEKGKTRLQAFEGIVLGRKHGTEAGATFTVRRVANGYGVEKVFPLYSPLIDKIEVSRRSKVRRSKMYHIRRKAAKEIKRKMRNMTLVSEVAVDESIPAETEEVKKEEAKVAENK